MAKASGHAAADWLAIHQELRQRQSTINGKSRAIQEVAQRFQCSALVVNEILHQGNAIQALRCDVTKNQANRCSKAELKRCAQSEQESFEIDLFLQPSEYQRFLQDPHTFLRVSPTADLDVQVSYHSLPVLPLREIESEASPIDSVDKDSLSLAQSEFSDPAVLFTPIKRAHPIASSGFKPNRNDIDANEGFTLAKLDTAAEGIDDYHV
jgi:hypothetical protein